MIIKKIFPFLIIIAFFLCIYLDCPSARSRISWNCSLNYNTLSFNNLHNYLAAICPRDKLLYY